MFFRLGAVAAVAVDELRLTEDILFAAPEIAVAAVVADDAAALADDGECVTDLITSPTPLLGASTDVDVTMSGHPERNAFEPADAAAIEADRITGC